MSVSQTVFLARAKLPGREAWSQAVRQHGFDLTFDETFDPARDDGYIPCTYAGRTAGFEYFRSKTRDPDQHPGCDLAIAFCTHSQMDDLKAATIAAAVLADLAGGVLHDDEGDEVVEDPLTRAREIERDVTPARDPPDLTPRSEAVDWAPRVVFRGQATTILETTEAPLRRFTIKVGGEGDVHIHAVWKRPAGRDTIHRVRIGAAEHELDPDGRPMRPRDVRVLVAQLGTVESAAPALLAAGTAAVAPLCELAADASKPLETRRAAVVILGQLGGKDAISFLQRLAADPQLGVTARRSLEILAG